ncbi:DeoR/GlpR family DNA-binding transcription regulator [Tepidibacillus fermentans]|uniref:DeoR family transcriptional regulator n=1 Tax=Tepidibacillus fermentans TaxID=1281767 RepID=A0A4R3KLW1_9BACI|nr:DeoR/GlpR family DNA-binding transcription regulator [Tepidibacillus fermentans]TCS83843.1 DeoR family transcriptional regulator [Tepidibacillus fermentans]
MYSEERKALILDYIQKKSRASVQELGEYLNVSESTIRRDLKELEDLKLLKRTHGGAISVENVNFEPTFREKEDQYFLEKGAIAKRAVEFIKEGDTILLDSGTTIFHVVKELKRFQKLTVVTNSLIFAHELQDSQGIDVIIIGGFLRRETLALVGPLAEEALSAIKVDKAFIATNGLDIKEGLTTPNLIEASTKRKMIESSKQVFLLADHSKIGKIAFAKFANINKVDKLIIDDAVPEYTVKELIKLGIEVVTVTVS